MSVVRLLILGTGAMAGSHAEAFAAIDGVQMVAAVDTDPDRLNTFADTHRIQHRFGSLAEAIAWGDFDAATNVTPDGVHHRTTMPLLEAGKHVLCEKPLATNEADAREMAEAASRAGVVNMVNLTYRNVPSLTAARRLVADGALGTLRHFDAAYLQSWLTQPLWGDWRTEPQWLWRLSQAHGSAGVLGDVGVHIVDFLTHVAGEAVTDLSCRLTTFDKAEGGKIGEYPLDANDSMVMQARLAGGASGVIHASRMATGHINDLILRLHGTEGALELRYIQGSDSLSVCLGPEAMKAAAWSPMDPDPTETNFARFIAAIRGGTPVQPDFAHGAALQRVLDLAIRSDADGARVLPVGA